MNNGFDGRLSIDEYQELVAAGQIDTVLCATPDPYGRLVGKRLTVSAFETLCVAGDGVNVSSFIFAVDIEMNPLDLPVSNAENGWLDVFLVPDLSTMRRVPWEPKTALVVCDVHEQAGGLLSVAPRTILRRQIDRAKEMGFAFKFASELEFFLAAVSPDEAWAAGYRGMRMTSNYRSDYQMLQSGRDEWFISQIRDLLPKFGVPIESSKPEWGLGQQEVTLDYCPALEMADRHVLFKHAVKELAHRAGLTASFMAKPLIDEVGSSCHLHVSMWNEDLTTPLGWEDSRISPEFGAFVAGQLERAVEFTFMFAPTVNAYKRFIPDQFAGTVVSLGSDNRSCGFRLVGNADSFRVENRIPGADVNPFYAFSATIAAGLDAVARGLPCPDIFDGNAWKEDRFDVVPSSLHESLAVFGESRFAVEALGEDVFQHLLESGRSELRAFESGTVTDWELRRYYERV